MHKSKEIYIRARETGRAIIRQHERQRCLSNRINQQAYIHPSLIGPPVITPHSPITSTISNLARTHPHSSHLHPTYHRHSILPSLSSTFVSMLARALVALASIALLHGTPKSPWQSLTAAAFSAYERESNPSLLPPSLTPPRVPHVL